MCPVHSVHNEWEGGIVIVLFPPSNDKEIVENTLYHTLHNDVCRSLANRCLQVLVPQTESWGGFKR